MKNLETVKTVNGYKIQRVANTKRFYYVFLTENSFVTFNSVKKATAYIETL